MDSRQQAIHLLDERSGIPEVVRKRAPHGLQGIRPDEHGISCRSREVLLLGQIGLGFDVNWGAGFDAGRQSFLFAGHAKYTGATTDDLGGNVRASLLAQPQLGWDVGKAMTGHANQLFLGVEYQCWWNKLGVDDGDNARSRG